MNGLRAEMGDHRLPERFWANVEAGALGCWQWTASLATNGYGTIHFLGKRWRAHRLAYFRLVGEVDAGLVLDHLCRNRGCVNPAHLEPVTSGENTLRGIGTSALYARQTHCLRGHEFTAENTYIRPTRPRSRFCRECMRIHRRANRARARAARKAAKS